MVLRKTGIGSEEQWSFWTIFVAFWDAGQWEEVRTLVKEIVSSGEKDFNWYLKEWAGMWSECEAEAQGF